MWVRMRIAEHCLLEEARKIWTPSTRTPSQVFGNARQVVYFGHYPSSCIVAPQPGFRALIQGGLVYLSGEVLIKSKV
jgi:hypothetical protein